MKLAFVSNQHQDNTNDDCMVRVIAEARGGSARTLVRCIYGATFHHVHPSSVREFFDIPLVSGPEPVTNTWPRHKNGDKS